MEGNPSVPGPVDASGVERRTLERVKTAALAAGVHVSDEVIRGLGGGDALTVHEYPTTGGITLVLPQEVLVNAAFDEPFCAGTPLSLVATGDGYELRLDGDRIPVLDVLPLPGYLDAVDAAGRAVTDVAMSHADRVRLSPIAGCAYDCKFCDLPGHYATHSVEQVLAGLDVAIRDDVLPARHVLISGGSPGQNPKQQQYFRDICVAILRHVRDLRDELASPLQVDIMMSARRDGPDFVNEMVAEGSMGSH
jgi:hypothetical protein